MHPRSTPWNMAWYMSKKPEAPVDAALAAARKMRDDAIKLVEELEARASIAASTPPEPPKPVTLRDRIQNALMSETLTTAKLSKALGEPVDVVSREIAAAKGEGKVMNVAFDDDPHWTWRPGDDISTQDLKKLVRRLLSERPMWIKDLVHVTGARASRVDGVLTELKRTEKVVDAAMGMGRPGQLQAKMYFIPTGDWKVDGATDATMPKRATTRAGRAAAVKAGKHK